MYKRSKLPYIRDYETAAELEATMSPIRGRDIKPLGPRRNLHQQILKHPDGSIACRLYQTDVVIFRPNGETVMQMEGWASQSTTAFASDVMGLRFDIFDNQVWVHCQAKMPNEENALTHGSFPLSSYAQHIFVRDRYGVQTLQNPVTHEVHSVDRKKANNVRSRYKKFRTFIENTIKLRDDGRGKAAISKEELGEVFGSIKPSPLWVLRAYTRNEKNFREFQELTLSEKPEDLYKAFLWLATGTNMYRMNECVNKIEMDRAFNEVFLSLHRDEVFTTKPCFGQMVRDPYGKYFSGTSDQSA